MKPIKDITGERFGNLIVIGLPDEGYQGKKTKWICKCDCGNVLTRQRKNLTHAVTSKCIKCNSNKYEVKEDYVIVYDFNNLGFVIDLEDFEEVRKYTWIFHNRYIKRNISRKDETKKGTEYLHRFLMNPPDDMFIDHIDRNPINNRRSNLRICTRSQNAGNLFKHNISDTTSKFKGVYLDKKASRWIARIYVNNKRYFLGKYKTEIEAAKAYNKKAKELHGEFAKLNAVK